MDWRNRYSVVPSLVNIDEVCSMHNVMFTECVALLRYFGIRAKVVDFVTGATSAEERFQTSIANNAFGLLTARSRNSLYLLIRDFH